MSTRTLAYDWPRRLAQSPAPRHRDLPDLRIRHGPDQADQCEPGDDRAQHPCQPGPGAAGQRERDPLQQAPQPCRPPLVPGGQPLHLLSERRDRAGRVVADEAADLQPGQDGPPAAGQVVQAAPVPVVHPRRQRPAVTAGHRPRGGAGYDLHAAVQVLHVIEVQPAQMREQQVQRTGFPAGELVQQTTPTVARHDQDLGDPDRDRTAVPMRNELRDREPAVSPAQPLVQDGAVSGGEAQPSIDAMENGTAELSLRDHRP
jgi:hypothetical protein